LEKGRLNLIENIYEYVLDNSLRESDVLSRLRQETEKDSSAIMQIPAEQGQFMALLVKLIGAKRTIEIGVYDIAHYVYPRPCQAIAILLHVMSVKNGQI